MSERDSLNQRIAQLEAELIEKNQELALYRHKLESLNGEIEGLIKKLSQEVFLAQKIQRTLSPTDVPNIPGFDFSTKFIPGHQGGGDYFDIFELNNRMSFVILLSQSSGYGTSATFLSVLIKLLSRKESKNFTRPSEFVELIRREISSQLAPTDELHVLVAIVNRRTLELSYCCAGDIPAVLRAGASDDIISLDAQTGPLKHQSPEIDPENHYVRMDLQAKDAIVFASRGLVQTLGRTGVLWGREGLNDAIRGAPRPGVHELRNEIFYQLERFAGTDTPVRDWTVVTTEVKERVMKLAPN